MDTKRLRCENCHRPLATKEDYAKYDDFQGTHLCWGDPWACDKYAKKVEADRILKNRVKSFHGGLVAEAFDLSRKKEKKTLWQLIIKAGEEYGEMCQAFLSMTGAPGNKWRGKTQEDMWEEIIDQHLVNLAIMARSEMTQDKYEKMMRKKLDSWLKKINKKTKGSKK